MSTLTQRDGDPITRRLTRRGMLGLTGGAMAAAGLAACAGPGSTGSQPTTVQTENVAGEVSFAHWRGEDRAVFDKIIAEFTAANPDITVTQDITQSNDFQSQALRRVRDGSVGDVVPTFRGAQFVSFVDAGIYADPSDTGLADFYDPSLIEPGALDGKQWGFPYQVVLPMPLVNLDLLDKAGVSEVPSNWDGYLDALDKLKSSGVTPLAFPGGHAGDAGQYFNTMIANLAPDADMCTKIESGDYKCTDDWFVQMLSEYAELAPYVQKGAGATQSEPAQQMFASGQAAMLCSGSYHLAAVRALDAEFDMDVFPPMSNTDGDPTFEGSYNATFILGINSASDVQGAALAWLQHLSTPEVASVYASETAQFSTVKGVEYDSDDLSALAPWLEKNLILAPRFQFLDLDLRNAVEASCIAALTGTKPEKAAEDAQKIVDERIAARG